MVKPILIWLCDKRHAGSIVWGCLLSRRRVVRFVLLGAAAVTLAGYGAYAKRSNRAMAADQAVSFAGRFGEPQISNRAAKTNRLLIEAALIDAGAQRTYTLASVQADGEIERPANPAIAATASIPAAEPAPAVEPKAAAVAPMPSRDKPNDKPKRLPPPAQPAATGLLDDGQISGLKGRLRLTSEQAEYWPAVEAALRDVVRTQLRGSKHVYGGKVNIDTNSPEVQKLIWAAMPLLMRLREDQKGEVRKLARVIGLEQVASQI
jgi:hypothetical protein